MLSGETYTRVRATSMQYFLMLTLPGESVLRACVAQLGPLEEHTLGQFREKMNTLRHQ